MQTPKIQTLEPGDRARIAAVLRAHGVTRASVFGSFARGSQSDDSDLDLLIEPKAGATLLDLARLELALEDLMGRHIDLVTFDELHPALREHVLREQVDLVVATTGG